MSKAESWVVRRKPGTRRQFEVVSYNEKGCVTTIAKEFDDIGDARQFAEEANRMLAYKR